MSPIKKELVSEIYWLRAIACLFVILNHALGNNLALYFSGQEGIVFYLLKIFQMAILFGTGTFVFISEFLNAKTYHGKPPQGFFQKRALFLLLPFLFMSFIFAIFDTAQNGAFTLASYSIEVIKNIFLGDFVLWFILLLFQIHILHFLFNRYSSKLKPLTVILASFVLNFGYLAYFSATTAPGSSAVATYIWERGYWLLAVGWIFYFTLAYYAGKHFEQVKRFISQQGVWLFAIIPVCFIAVMGFQQQGIFTIISSKRPDMMLYTIAMIGLILYLSGKTRSVPRLIMLISKYSFSLYLLHMIVMKLLLQFLPKTNFAVSFVVCYVGSIAVSTVIANLFNRFSFGKYLVGNLLKTPKQDSSVKPALHVGERAV
ncbi:Membrane-bound acyltransferase YfiQ, involved in biofilm formation [Paenibacillus algorifonticola]|uniref:Membrane-bound acyltransferase YfiQ, involved in biofilm formation n=1 Tax=Paenibacillus algorifonticola TaxID=684063 RepID=A0A1I1XYZ0_9BACL|nr:acyltransferase family protein [Paenibacillus algorifonticola]SFE12566.1 Membrane-bound acyltransferase YfiQ, involved in biofilm formation [Paenibacillus algorifonticola]